MKPNQRDDDFLYLYWVNHLPRPVLRFSIYTTSLMCYLVFSHACEIHTKMLKGSNHLPSITTAATQHNPQHLSQPKLSPHSVYRWFLLFIWFYFMQVFMYIYITPYIYWCSLVSSIHFFPIHQILMLTIFLRSTTSTKIEHCYATTMSHSTKNQWHQQATTPIAIRCVTALRIFFQ